MGDWLCCAKADCVATKRSEHPSNGILTTLFLFIIYYLPFLSMLSIWEQNLHDVIIKLKKNRIDRLTTR